MYDLSSVPALWPALQKYRCSTVPRRCCWRRCSDIGQMVFGGACVSLRDTLRLGVLVAQTCDWVYGLPQPCFYAAAPCASAVEPIAARARSQDRARGRCWCSQISQPHHPGQEPFKSSPCGGSCSACLVDFVVQIRALAGKRALQRREGDCLLQGLPCKQLPNGAWSVLAGCSSPQACSVSVSRQ